MATPKNDSAARSSTHPPTAAAPADFALVRSKLIPGPGGALTPDGKVKHIEVVISPLTVADYHQWITDPAAPLAKRTANLRAKLGPGGTKTAAFNEEKPRLPHAVPAINAPAETPLAGIDGKFHSGIYSYDIDEGEADWNELRKCLAAMPSCLLVATSSSGDGLYAFIVGTPATTATEYTAKWREARQFFPEGVNTSTADGSNNINRLRYVCYDPEAYLAATVTPLTLTATQPPSAAGRKKGNTSHAHFQPDSHEDLRKAVAHVRRPVSSGSDYKYWRDMLWAMNDAGVTLADAQAWCADYTHAADTPRVWEQGDGGITAKTFWDAAKKGGYKKAKGEPKQEADSAAKGKGKQEANGEHVDPVAELLWHPWSGDTEWLIVTLDGEPHHVGPVERTELAPKLSHDLATVGTQITDQLGDRLLALGAEAPEIFRPGDFAPRPAGWACEPLMLDQGVSVIFGPNCTGKSLLAISVALTLASGTAMPGLTAPPDPGVTLYLDAEDSWGNFSAAGRAMATSMGIVWGAGIPLLYFPTHRLLPDLERTLAALVEREGVKYIVADSISRLFPSCIDMDVVNTNWQILERLGCPTMTVAHTPRKDKSAVYGSRAVTGNARLVTCISTPDGEEGLHTQYWSCTKSNGPVGWPGNRGVLYDFSRPGIISRTVTAGKPADVAAADKNIAAIVDALADGVQLTRAQLIEKTGLGKSTLYSLVARMLADGLLENGGRAKGPVWLSKENGA